MSITRGFLSRPLEKLVKTQDTFHQFLHNLLFIGLSGSLSEFRSNSEPIHQYRALGM